MGHGLIIHHIERFLLTACSEVSTLPMNEELTAESRPAKVRIISSFVWAKKSTSYSSETFLYVVQNSELSVSWPFSFTPVDPGETAMVLDVFLARPESLGGHEKFFARDILPDHIPVTP